MSDDFHRPSKFGQAGPEIQRLREENQHLRSAKEGIREQWAELLKDNAAKAAEITRLRAALATARREGEAAGIEWGAGMISAFMKIADKMSDGLGLERDPVKAIEFAIARTLEEAAAIRAAAKEDKP